MCTSEYASSTVCVSISVCISSLTIMRGVQSKEMVFLLSFLFHFSCYCAVFLSFSSSLSYYFCSCCLKDCSYPSTFFMFLFFSSFSHLLCVQLHLCLHFSLIVLPFGFLFSLILLWFGIYVFLRSVNTTLMGYFPTGCH